MNVETVPLLALLARPETTFEIPIYQRMYSWRERQCRELWTDLERAARQRRDHFLGTILYTPVSDSETTPTRLAIIDGQQRLTTIVLMLCALSEWLDARDVTLEGPDGPLDGAALRQTLLLANADQPAESKLALAPGDNVTLQAVLSGDDLGDEPSRTVAENVALFRALMEEDDFDPRSLWRGLNGLQVITVEVENALSVQSFFESLNSKGLALNVADLARNYLLLSENHEEQTRLYNEYWAAMEEIYHPDPGSKRLDSGIRAWLSIRLRTTKILTVEQSYSEFKRYVEDKFHGDKESILQELRSFSLMWAENFRYHGVKKYKSSHNWAINGAPILTAGRPLIDPPGPEYFEKLRERRDAIADYW